MERGDVGLPSEQTVEVGIDAALDAAAETAKLPDFLLAAAVDDAVIGDVLADLPEAQPNRSLQSASDFSSLYVRHRSGLAAHARRYLRDQRDVDEVVQETFLRLFLAISEIETELQAIAFARRTLTNLCIDRYRADKRRPTLITLDANPFFDLNGAEEDPDPVLQAEDAAIVRDALSRLSPLHREALVKREIEEKPLPQIAAELGIAEDSVKHLLFRARRALRRLLIGTSVEPGIDLTGDSDERIGSALVRNAPVFIFFLVAALVAGVGARPLFSGSGHGQPAHQALGLPDLNLSGPEAPAPKILPPAAVARHHKTLRRHHHQPSVSKSAVSSTSAPVIRINEPPAVGTHEPAAEASSGSGGHAPRGHFRLSGPLEVTGAPRVAEARVIADPNGSAVASYSFSAPTDHGRFDLSQSFSTSPTGGSAVSVTPTFVVGDVVQAPVLTGTTSAVRTASDGTVDVDVVVGAQPDLSTNAFPLTAMTAHIELTPDLSRVISETVTLEAHPQTATDATAEADSPAPSAPTGTGQAGDALPPEAPAPPPRAANDCSLATGTTSRAVTCAAPADTKPSRPASVTPDGGP